MSQPLPLGAALATLPPLAGEPLVALAHRLGEALLAAEAQGIGAGVHGGRVSLSPDSFSLDASGQITLRPGQLSQDERAGYRTWSAPEQRGPSPEGDVRAWLFSLSAILYEAATGDALFEARSPPEVEALVTGDLDGHLLMTGVRGRMRAACPDLVPAVLAALQADPASRPDGPTWMGTLPAASVSGDQELDALLRRAISVAAPPPPEPEPDPDPRWEVPPPLDAPGSDSLGGQSHEVALAPRAPSPRAPIPGPPASPSAQPTLRSTMPVAPATNSRVRPQSELGYRVRTTGQRLLRWALVLGLLLAGLVATTWLGFLPTLPRAVADAVEGAGAPVASSLPAGLRDGMTSLWEHRSDRSRGHRLWDGLVARLPADRQASLRRAVDPRAELTWPGEPIAEGIVTTPRVAITPADGTSLTLSLTHAGSGAPLGSELSWTATPIPDPREDELSADLDRMEGAERASVARTPVRGSGPDPVPLPPGFWDVELTVQPSELAGPYLGTLRGVRTAPGHASVYVAQLTVPSGSLTLTADAGGPVAAEHVQVAVYAPEDGDTIRRAEKTAMQTARDAGKDWHATVAPAPTPAPIWQGPLTSLPALPSGPVAARLVVEDGVHHPTVAWLKEVAVPAGGLTVARTIRLELDEVMAPTEPGLRVRARNLAHDVSPYSTVFVFPPGGDVAVATGRAGHYLALQPGPYDLRVVYEPPAAGLGVRGETTVKGFTVGDSGVSEASVDIGFPAATVRITVLEGGRDVSDTVAVRIMRVGVDREAGTPVVDETEVAEHVVPADTYDIYLSRAAEPRIEAAFPAVTLAAGDVWSRELDVAQQPWTSP